MPTVSEVESETWIRCLWYYDFIEIQLVDAGPSQLEYNGQGFRLPSRNNKNPEQINQVKQHYEVESIITPFYK